MPEEVTYATLKFPNPSKSVQLQECCSLKRTENHEVPEAELDQGAGSEARDPERPAAAAAGRAAAGQYVPSKLWGPVAFVFLLLNLIVLAALGTLILMNYHQLSFSNSTAYDGQPSALEQLERTITLYMDMYKNVSSEHTVFKNMLEDTLKQWNNSMSKFYEDLMKEKNDLSCCSCTKSCTQHESKERSFFPLRCEEKKYNLTQLFITCLPSPDSGMKQNHMPTMTTKAKNVSEFCILTCLDPF